PAGTCSTSSRSRSGWRHSRCFGTAPAGASSRRAASRWPCWSRRRCPSSWHERIDGSRSGAHGAPCTPRSTRRRRSAPDLRLGAMSLRARQLLLLLQPTARASEWLAPVAGAVLAVAVDRLAGGISASLGLELAAIALALGASFALDDPAAESLGASPLPLVLRHAVRAACAIPIPLGIWLVLILQSQGVSRGALTKELA